MAANFVEIKIRADDTAKPDISSLKADLDELGSKVDSARIDVDDDDAKRKLFEINAELAALNKRVASPRIDTASAARAESRIEKLKGDVGDLVSKVDSSNSSSGGRGLLAKLMFGAQGIEGAGSDATGGLEGLGNSLSGGLLAKLALLVPAIEAGSVELAGLVSGFAVAGAGAGAFALLALPAFHAVSGALKDTHAQLMKLSPDERGAVYGIRGLEHELDRMSKAFEPDAFRVFNQGLKIANQLLPLAKPFADTFATSLDGLLKQVSKFTGSTGFKDWVKQFHSLEGPSVHAIGEGIGKVAVQIGKLLTVMSSKDVVHSINIAFDVLAGTIEAVIVIVKRLMHNWDELSSAFRRVRHDIAADAHEIAHIFDDLRHDAANLAHNLASYFDEIRANIHRWADDVGRDATRVVSWFRALPGRIMSTLSRLPGELFSFGAHIISMLARGIASAIGDVTGAIGHVAGEILDHIPHSPARKGPLSGRGDPRLGGLRIGQMLAEGLAGSAGTVSAAAGRVAAATIPHPGVAGGHGAPLGRLELEWVNAGGDAGFFTWLRKGIRVRGGLQKALGP